jgi:trimeric autotransporter adhesin
MAETPEPRALSAALASPAFVTRGGGLAMHVANKHVERWAPEAGASRVRSLKNLGFVDRLVAPWIEAAQRSASLRMFSQYISTGVGERPSNNVSWVFPRPWYQDELDWMAAARTAQPQQSPTMLTTRGTYVAPQANRAAEAALPAALYEYVAPSLSVARTDASAMGADAYSPLVPHAATQAATVMSRVMAPLAPTRALSPGLRAVLTTMLERSAHAPAAAAPTRTSLMAPELVTPPAPRRDDASAHQALEVADQFAEQSARLAELQRAARVVVEREVAARQPAQPIVQPIAELARTTVTSSRSDAAASTSDAVAAERARIEERIAQRLAERTAQTDGQRAADAQRTTDAQRAADAQRTQDRVADAQRATEARRAELAHRRDDAVRLHEQAREAAARDARTAPVSSPAAEPPAGRQVPSEIVAALSALPAELQSVVAAGIGSRPERAAQAIGELSEALRTIELMARTTAAGGTFESSRGPRLMMPAGLGGLVATIERTTGESRGMSPLAARALAESRAAAAPGDHAEPGAAAQARAAQAAGAQARAEQARAARMPALSFLAPRVAAAPSPTSALGATSAAEPAALGHVAWADRWLARFAGAKTQSLDVLSVAAASPEMRLAALAAAAPGVVFVAPELAEPARRDGARTFAPGAAEQGAFAARTLDHASAASTAADVVRYSDDAETPDDVFAAISQAATRSRTAPSPATAAQAAAAAAAAAEASRTFERETLADLVAHAVPVAPGAGLGAQLASSPFAPALRHVLPLASAPAFDVRALFGAGLGATYLAGLLASATREITIGSAAPAWANWDRAAAHEPALRDREAADWQPEYVAPSSESGAALVSESGAALAATEAVTTMRSALLSWTVDAIDAGARVETRVGAPTVSPVRESSSPMRSMLDAMTLPTLGETAALQELGAIELAGVPARASSYAAPGAIADRAQAWSVAQERSSADLSFDFVPPELVLAARVYGLGPAEAAQAARLAIAGAGSLAAMAGAVDRTFIHALAIEHERRTGQAITAYPTTAASGHVAASGQAGVSGQPGAPMAATPTSSFGVDRRAPRGAFLWPSASVAALGLSAASPDGESSTSVAALELLAAQTVAELGTYAALSPELTARPAAAPAPTAAPAEGSEQEVLAAAGSIVGSARRAKFEAMYVALGQSSAARNWSPAARAARAVALAGRGDDTITARERAEIAWDVLPVVSVGELGADGEPAAMSTGQAAQRAAQRREAQRSTDFSAYVAPGLGSLSSRAGEALGSYVTPQAAAPAASASQSSSTREPGAVMRVPTAAPELVRTGRSGGKHGGGEHELPAWFAEAAKKMMLDDRSGPAENISLSELTLVTSAPSTHIAASSRGAPSTTPASPKAPDAKEAKLDIEKIATDVYKEILVIMDATRARNGEPYL